MAEAPLTARTRSVLRCCRDSFGYIGTTNRSLALGGSFGETLRAAHFRCEYRKESAMPDNTYRWMTILLMLLALAVGIYSVTKPPVVINVIQPPLETIELTPKHVPADLDDVVFHAPA